jgi:tetratricopeptide (TPR) repeat protein
MGNNAVRGTLIALLTMVLIAGLCTILVMRLPDNRSLDEDVFVVSDVNTALPAAQSPAAVIKAILAGITPTGSYRPIVIDYPFEGSIFPPEIVTPRFLWHDDAEDAGLWLVDSSFDTGPHHIYALTGGRLPERRIDPEAVSPTNEHYRPSDYDLSTRAWSPDEATWELIKANSVEAPATITIMGIDRNDLKVLSRGTVRIATSRDAVGAPIFYRDVPLMPSITKKGQIKPLAPEALPLISWRLRDISKASAPVLLKDMPTCGNCHSFSRDGSILAMDMDGPKGDKGAYAITKIKKDIVITADDIISWNSYRGAIKGQKTIGMFSQISPDGRYVVSTLNESVFVGNYTDFRFLQSFYPTRGILVVYDKSTGQMNALPGADDVEYVHVNGCWSPNGDRIVFSRAPAKDRYESEEMPTHVGDPNETFIQYDLYVIPFNNGRGGRPKPLEGASSNGMSNSFARYSPDGKWIVFVQSAKGQLMRPDSKLYIVPAEGGKARRMNCNLPVMNSWHSFSPSGRWMVFSSKGFSPFTQMFVTHIDEDGNDSPAIFIPNSTADNRAVNIPEFLNNSPDAIASISAPSQESHRYFKKALALREKGQYPEALAELEKSIQIDEFYARAHNEKGYILFEMGDVNQATVCFKKAIELDPDYGMPRGNLGSLLQSQGRLDEAVDNYRQALELDPGLAEIHFNYANILRAQEKLDEAIQHYRNAIAIQPSHAEGHFNLGVALQQKGMLEEAIESYRKALDINPDYAKAHYGLGVAMVRQGDMDGACEHLERSVELTPENPSARLDLARVLHAKGQYDLAIKHYDEALRIRPDHPITRMGLADALFRRGRFLRAVEECRTILRTQGENAVILNMLAWMLATGDSDVADYSQAVELAEKACRLTELKSPELLDTLAAAYAAGGKFSQAAATAREAIKLANQGGNEALAKTIQERLELYNRGKPYVQPSRLQK